MLFVIFVIGVLGALVIAREPLSSWVICLVVLLVIVHIPPVKRHFLWWLGRFVTNNNTRLGALWVLIILFFLSLLICTAQALGQIDNRCVPGKNFTNAQARSNFVSRGGVLCETRVSRAWYSPKTLLTGWGVLGLLALGGIGYVPIALSDDLARAKERRTARAATRTTQQGQVTPATAVTGRLTRGRFLEGLAAAGIMDVIVGAIIHQGRE